MAGIYKQAKALEMYLPSLQRMPDAWTIAVKVNDSGGERIPFGGPGDLVFDRHGYAWITNNVVQGTPDSTRGIIVLKPNGQPADGVHGTPASPIIGGGILGSGFGIDIDTRGTVWLGNFGWGGVDPSPTGNGSVSQFTALGLPISGPQGHQGGTNRVQGTVSDQDNNIWIASYENNRVVVFPDSICQTVCERTIKGNWDDALATTETDNPTLQWHQRRLGSARLAFLKELPNTIELVMSGKQIRLLHASPKSVHSRVRQPDPVEKLLAMFDNTDFTGHRMTPDVVGYGDIHEVYVRSFPGKTLFNVGSVGNPHDTPQAAYGILEGTYGDDAEDALSIHLVRVP